MKLPLLAGVANGCFLPTPQRASALVLLWALAFSPSFSYLLGFQAYPLASLGPLSAGIWLAGALSSTRLAFTLLSAALSGLVWLMNWLMLAAGDCCSVGGH